jgi:hypothetical protein
MTQIFTDVPTSTGDLEEGINSYGGEVARPCHEAHPSAICTVSDPSSWCGFTTAAPPNVLSTHSTYLSSATSLWRTHGATMSVVETECPVVRGRSDISRRTLLKIAMAHTECYVHAHPEATMHGNGQRQFFSP